MKHCIWCRKTEEETTFNKLAHTIPKSLGGINICTNVCDICNDFFGRHYQTLPPIETVLKETFNISRFRFLHAENRIGKNKPLSKLSSIYFNVNFKEHRVELKQKYLLHQGYQEKICRQLKKGLYKIFLEETERQKGNGHDYQFDFIREFARYDLDDYPVFYFERLHGIIMLSSNWAIHPELFLDEAYQFEYLVREPSFFEFEFLGHVFGIATSRHWEIAFDNYKRKTIEAKRGFFKRCQVVTKFNDIDLTLSILNDRPKN